MHINHETSVQAKKIQNYFFYGLLLIVMSASFYLFWPFISTLVVSAMIAVILFPLYSWIQDKIGSNGLSAFISILSKFDLDNFHLREQFLSTYYNFGAIMNGNGLFFL